MRTFPKTSRPNRQRAVTASSSGRHHQASHARRNGRRGQQRCCTRSVAGTASCEQTCKSKGEACSETASSAACFKGSRDPVKMANVKNVQVRPSRRPPQPADCRRTGRRRRRTSHSAGSGDCRTRSQAVGKTCGRKEMAVEIRPAIRLQIRPQDARGRLMPARDSSRARTALAQTRHAIASSDSISTFVTSCSDVGAALATSRAFRQTTGWH